MATDRIRVVTEKKEKAKKAVSKADSKFKFCSFELALKNNMNLQDFKEILSWLKEMDVGNRKSHHWNRGQVAENIFTSLWLTLLSCFQ